MHEAERQIKAIILGLVPLKMAVTSSLDFGHVSWTASRRSPACIYAEPFLLRSSKRPDGDCERLQYKDSERGHAILTGSFQMTIM